MASSRTARHEKLQGVPRPRAHAVGRRPQRHVPPELDPPPVRDGRERAPLQPREDLGVQVDDLAGQRAARVPDELPPAGEVHRHEDQLVVDDRLGDGAARREHRPRRQRLAGQVGAPAEAAREPRARAAASQVAAAGGAVAPGLGAQDGLVDAAADPRQGDDDGGAHDRDLDGPVEPPGLGAGLRADAHAGPQRGVPQRGVGERAAWGGRSPRPLGGASMAGVPSRAAAARVRRLAPPEELHRLARVLHEMAREHHFYCTLGRYVIPIAPRQVGESAQGGREQDHRDIHDAPNGRRASDCAARVGIVHDAEEDGKRDEEYLQDVAVALAVPVVLRHLVIRDRKQDVLHSPEDEDWRIFRDAGPLRLLHVELPAVCFTALAKILERHIIELAWSCSFW
mmetsp:Transcript_42522/g.110716  ORF Transcript_42522/g.110716 Transcript_42522/m.110716 type:complete len:397 (-) Transcript_42522:789-1979(-)